MSEKFFGKSEIENLFGSLSGVKVIESNLVPKNKIFVIKDEFTNYFDKAFKRLEKAYLKNWVWHDFTKLRPETIHKIRKCRKISLAKKK